ncbi:Tn3 family transposase [Streptomyces sp. NPDC088766]|uniref:Tn3 family transposase n=1 Tax=Streptomyces sp. NPDC088766 TaxID=3365893 RepID=UPI00382AB6A0
MERVDGLGDAVFWVGKTPPAKVAAPAEQARVLSAGEMKEIAEPRRTAMTVCLLAQVQAAVRDETVVMLSKRMSRHLERAQEGLLEIEKRQKETTEQLLAAFRDVLTALRGIDLLPRIRNFQDLTFHRPDSRMRHRRIDALFSADPGTCIDWQLIESGWKDLMQVGLSVGEGAVSSVTLLRRMNNHSRKNRIYRVFREVGRAVRTIVLLRHLSDPQLREHGGRLRHAARTAPRGPASLSSMAHAPEPDGLEGTVRDAQGWLSSFTGAPTRALAGPGG